MGELFKAGQKPWNWKGDPITDSRGYVLIFVGKDHHLADVRGYAYKHRLVAEEKLGRRLLPGEEVHHGDDNPSNNDPGNLIPAANHAEHALLHRASGKTLRMPGEDNPIIQCACGCGETFLKYDGEGRPRHYVKDFHGGKIWAKRK